MHRRITVAVKTYYAHTDDRRGPESWDLLSSHLEATAFRCEEFCRAFAPQSGRLVGLWHDLGKYQPAFQRYLLRETPRGPKHSIVGAYHAYSFGRLDLAMIIAAHHGHLAEKGDFLNGIERGGAVEYEIPTPFIGPFPAEEPPADAISLWMRFVFSALVDADSLETELWRSIGQVSIFKSCINILNIPFTDGRRSMLTKRRHA
jgi:CRISPR-associated endonuclease/helicase Cas3